MPCSSAIRRIQRSLLIAMGLLTAGAYLRSSQLTSMNAALTSSEVVIGT